MELPDADGPFRLRLKSVNGEAWLRSLGVSRGDAPVRVTNWERVFRNRSQYKFTPKFVDDVASAHKFVLGDVAVIQQKILAEYRIETEIVAGDGTLTSTE